MCGYFWKTTNLFCFVATTCGQGRVCRCLRGKKNQKQNSRGMHATCRLFNFFLWVNKKLGLYIEHQKMGLLEVNSLNRQIRKGYYYLIYCLDGTLRTLLIREESEKATTQEADSDSDTREWLMPSSEHWPLIIRPRNINFVIMNHIHSLNFSFPLCD